MRVITDEDFHRLEKIKARLHAMRVTETGEDNFRRLTSSIADLDLVLQNQAVSVRPSVLASAD